MKKILVSIVSDQTIPNILFIRETSLVDMFYFITTELMEKRGKSGAIIEACNIAEGKYQLISVTEDSINDIEEKLQTIDFADQDKIIVNLTGGTKIMAIGTYNYFQKYGASIYYIPIEKNAYTKLYPTVKSRTTRLNYRISLLEYLKGYGIRVSPKGIKSMKTVFMAPDYTEYFLDSYLNFNDGDKKLIEQLRKNFRGKQIENIDSVKGLSMFLKKINFPLQKNTYLNKPEIKYLTGDWFEEYCFSKIKEIAGFPDDAIGTGVNIFKGDVQNEIDIMFVKNNSLHIIECKTDIADTSEGDISYLFLNTLYKAAALRQNFGLRVNYYVFALNNFDNLKKNQKDRAKMLRINILGAETLAAPEKFDEE